MAKNKHGLLRLLTVSVLSAAFAAAFSRYMDKRSREGIDDHDDFEDLGEDEFGDLDDLDEEEESQDDEVFASWDTPKDDPDEG